MCRPYAEPENKPKFTSIFTLKSGPKSGKISLSKAPSFSLGQKRYFGKENRRILLSGT